MTIDSVTAMTHRQLQHRDWRTAAVTLAAVASIGYAATTYTAAADEPEPQHLDARTLRIGLDLARILSQQCPNNGGVSNLVPDWRPNAPPDGFRFVCRDGAEFTDTVIRLK